MYIRTKDGVYEVDENSKGNDCFLWVKTNEANIVQCVWLNCIINQSENLEELCDEFVICLKNTIPYTVDTFQRHELLRDRAKLFKFYGTDAIFGAIWTNKGLIFVARMNDKGDLELI